MNHPATGNTSAELDEPTTPAHGPQPHPPMTEEDYDRLGLDLPKPPYLADIIRNVNKAPIISPERARRIREVFESAR